MATDFSYSDTTISTTGGFCPNKKNTPLDSRTIVNNKADITSIPVPYVGMEITVLQDETKGNKMTVYKVTSLNERNAIDINTGIEDVTVPKNVSQLTNDSGFLTDIPSEYVTETELNSKGYTTENYVNNKLDGHSFRFLTQVEYDNLPENERNNPLIEYHITDKADEGLTANQLQQLKTAYDHSQAVHAPVNAEENVQSDWNETNTNSDAYIKNKPTIPTKTSELTNDSSLATESFVTSKIAEASLSGGEVDLSSYQLKSDTSLTTDNKTVVGAINEVNSSLSTKVGTSEVNSAINSYVTEHKAELKGEKGDKGEKGENGTTFTPSVDTLGNLSWSNNGGLTNPDIVNIKGEKGDKGDKGADGAKGEKGDKGDKGDNGKDGLTTSVNVNGNTYNHVNGTITLPNYPTVPTKTSQLTNDSGFITAIPEEYVTETELNSKGYLTSVPNEYVTETELNSKGFSKIWSGTQSAYDSLTDKTLYDYYFIEE